MEEKNERRILPVTTAIPDIIEGEFLIFFLKLQLRSFVFSILNCLCSFFFFKERERRLRCKGVKNAVAQLVHDLYLWKLVLLRD